jgi:cytochrome c556
MIFPNPLHAYRALNLTPSLRDNPAACQVAVSFPRHNRAATFNSGTNELMRRRILMASLAAAILAVPPAARAGEVSAIMHSWRHNQHAVDAMLAGRTPYDQAALRAAMTLYIADASGLASHIGTGTADARDLKQRFTNFAAAGQQARGDISQPASFQADVSQIKSQCDSCHAIYNN